jgi:hypothetical protein
MSNYNQILLKMNTYLLTVFTRFENVVHPAAGKTMIGKKKKRSAATAVNPKATPDSLNIRDLIKRQDSYRRNPIP